MGTIMDFLSDAANAVMGQAGNIFAGSADLNQQLNFCNKINAAVSSTPLECMREDQKMVFLKKVLIECGAADTPGTTLGSVYPLIAKRADSAEKNAGLPTAHETCPPNCTGDRSGCQECLQKRLAVLEALYYVDRPEEYKARVTAAHRKHSEGTGRKCSLCGAPITGSMRNCEYCGTPVSLFEEAILSASRIVPPEQAAYDLIYQMHVEAAEKMAADAEAQEILTAVQSAAAAQAKKEGYISDVQLKPLIRQDFEKGIALLKVKMSLSELSYMAGIYNLSVGIYLRGLFENDPNLQTAAAYRDRQKMERESQEQQRRHEEQMQAIRDDYARWKKNSDEFWERQRQIHTAPKYLGGSSGTAGKSCAGCRYFVLSSGYCAYKKTSVNAGDFCGAFAYSH